MARRRKKTIDANQRELQFPTECQKPSIEIGGNVGPGEKYFRYDINGDILLDDSFDLADSWWGLRFAGFPAQPVIVGRTQAMLKTFSLVEKFADSPIWVLLGGPSGTGKELVARALASLRRGPFVAVNCGLPKDGVSFEDTVFGRADKVINGAPEKEGAFQSANNGTLLLDNIEGLSWEQQTALLRVLDCWPQVVRKLGSSKDDIVQVRIICATNKNLISLVQRAQFREDLYYRINIVSLNLPPLCDRKDDIPLLAVYTLLKNRPMLPRQVSRISLETLEKICAYNWPGNVRQFTNSIKAALATGEGAILQPEEFDDLLQSDLIEQSQQIGRKSDKFSDSRKHKKTTKQKQMDEIEELLRQNPGANTKNLVKLSGHPLYTVQRVLRQLQQKKRVTKHFMKDGRVPCYFITAE